MAKLRFFYGAMGSGKSLELIRAAYNYRERGRQVLVFSSILDTRAGGEKIVSRTGSSVEAIFLSPEQDPKEIVLHTIKSSIIDAVLVDEAQFYTPEQIESLAEIAALHDIPVLVYGLRTDFTGKLFPGSKRLMELASYIEELPTVCHCGKRATMNARIQDGKIVKQGEIVQIGWNESYTSLCLKHYLLGEIQ